DALRAVPLPRARGPSRRGRVRWGPASARPRVRAVPVAPGPRLSGRGDTIRGYRISAARADRFGVRWIWTGILQRESVCAPSLDPCKGYRTLTGDSIARAVHEAGRTAWLGPPSHHDGAR